MKSKNLKFKLVPIAFGISIMTASLSAVWAADTAATSNAAAANSSSQIEEVIVTATRREESLQKVPISITAISTETLSQANVVNLQDVTRLSPGIQIAPQYKLGDAVYQIRGQAQTDQAPSIDPSVGVYFDDVYIARSSGSLMNLLDVQQVEVLKGPQGTLFGKNTTGGAIRVISNKPVDDFEGYVKVGYERFDRTTLEAVLNLPMSDTASSRFALQDIKKTRGYAINSVTGNPIDTLDQWSGRGSFLLKPTNKLSVLLEGDYSKINSGALATILRAWVPGASSASATAIEAALESGKGFNGAAGSAIMQSQVSGHGATPIIGENLKAANSQSYTFNPATGQFSFVGGSSDPNSNVETWGLLANITYDLGSATLKSITGYRHVKSNSSYALSGAQFEIVDSVQTVQTKQFSEELLLNGKAISDKLDWTIGGLYFHETPQQEDDAVSLAALSSLAGGRGTATIGRATNKSYGLFGQVTYNLTDKLSLTAGTRYTADEKAFDTSVYNRYTNGTEACLFTAAAGYPVAPGSCDIKEGKTFKNWTYNLSLAYQFDPDTMGYAHTSRGLRAGGFNPRVSDPGILMAFKPEIVTDYEVGLKSEWMEHRVRTNVALFYSEGTDVQNTVNGLSAAGNVITLTSNIGKRLVDGIEMDLTVKPTDIVSFDAGTSFMHAKSENPKESDVTYVLLTPRWAYHLGMNVDTSLWDGWKGLFRADLTGRGEIHDGAPFRNKAGQIIYVGIDPSLTLLGARYTITKISNGLEVSIYGRNLTNRIYFGRVNAIPSLGLDLGTLADPRVVGMDVKIPFGALAGK